LLCVAFLNPQAEATAPTARRGHALLGTISRIDTGHRAFVLDTRAGRQVRVRVTQNTRIAVDGSAATFADLAVGQHARVTGRKDPLRPIFVARTVQARN
jgi:hypothetical protein